MSNESHYTPRLDPSTTVPMTIDHCTHLDDSQLVGVAVNPADSTPATVGGVVDVEVKVSAVAAGADGAGQSGGGVVKRKRGRPPRAVAAGFVPKKEDEEEDVCFICFDGGSLVLCDRKGCPKAYHPACIKRDEAFFRSKAKWNCGWHICNSCQRASHYMCYTCPYSSCKGCTKDADYVCVRGNKGFCGICMRTIMLIENNSQGSQETVQVDFDDKSSWEYLFKVYWLYLKEKLSLTIDEITQATNPLKGNNNMAQNMEYSGKPRNVLDDSAVSNSKRRKINKQFLNQEMAVCMEKLDGDKGTPFLEGNERQHGSLYPGAAMNMENFGADGRTKLPDGAKWASKELLELVGHMKNGDTSMLSQFDVQALLLEYIKRNSLRDPHRKCEIICDSRLLNLFGKARVGHIEMLKLLEYHFLIKDNSKAEDILKGGRLEVSATLMDADISNSNQVIKGSFKTRNSCKKAEDPGQHNNSKELAATDVYNISLIYLRRNSMENLLENIEKFHDFVVGSFVRIRISDTDQKEEFYRLVQVVGTSKSDEQYTVGSRTVNIMLEVLNLEKRERISIDGISNQDFSEEECKRLRQSMEFGLIRRLTVGEIQEKAMTLHTMRVNEWLEAETLRLINLRDRASEKGQRKQLRECVEKIELLSSPEERQRRLQEIPEVHVDPSLSCHQKVGEDIQTLDKRKQGKPVRQRNTDSNRKRTASVGLQKVGGGVQNPVDPARAIISNLSKQLAGTSELPLSVSHLPQSVGIDQSGGNSEIDRIWHYQDPSGRTQGPFTMLQLRKWSMSGHFPLDLRIWRINENQDRSILLTDALRGHYDKVPLSHNNSHSLSQSVRATSNKENSSKDDTVAVFNNTFRKDSRPVDGIEHLSPSDTGSDSNDNRVSVKSGGAEHDVKVTSNDGSQNLLPSSEDFDYNDQRDLVKCNKGASRDVIVDLNNGGNCDGELEDSVEAIQNDSECLERNQYPMQNDNNSEHSPNKLVKSNEEDNQSCLNASENVVKSCEQQRGTQLQGLNPPRDDITPFQPQVCSLLPNLSENHSHTDYLGESSRGELSTHNENNANERFIIAEPQTISGHSSDKQCNSESYSSQSSGQYWRPPNIISPSEVWDSNSVIPSVDNSVENSELTGEANISDLPNPVPKPSSGGLNGQCTEEKLPSAVTPVHNIGASWSSASNVDSVPQIPEVACEWSGYSSTSAKPSAQNKDSCFLSASPLRLELAGHHAATSNSGSKQPRHLSPSNPAANLSTWQEIVSDPNEFLVDSEESVSDLLAEVEAMESLNAGNGPGTPTSMVNFGEDLTEDSRDDWFSPIGSFGPTPDTGKGEAIGTTGYLQLFPQSTEASTASDLQLPSQSTVTNDLCLSSQPDILDLQKKIGEHSTQGAELDVDAARRDVSVNQLEPDCGISHPQSMADWGISNTETSWRAGAVGSGMRWGPEQTNAKMISMVSEQRTGTMGYGFYQGQSQERFHMNMSWGPTPANGTNPVTLWNPARCSGDRSGPREANFQGGDPGYMRDKPSWHKQAFSNGGNSYRHSPKGQRVCKFYEKGYCKKGTSCSFLHP